MSSRAILGLASIGGLVVSMALPAFAQTTPNPNTSTQPTTTTTQPTTTQPTTTTNCPPATATTNGTSTSTSTTTAPSTNTSTNTSTTTNTNTANPNGTAPSSTQSTATGIPAKPTTTAGNNCTTTTPPAGTMQNVPPTTGENYNALTNNPNGSDWLAKFNRPNVRSSNYLGTTRCHYVMEHGTKTRICR